jgi:hypothetical protein
MLVDAQLGRELHGIACRGSEVRVYSKDATSTTAQTVAWCGKQKYWLTVDWSCQKAISWKRSVSTTAQKVSQEVVKHVLTP